MMFRLLNAAVLTLLLLAAGGCRVAGRAGPCDPADKLSCAFETAPRFRLGFYPSSTVGTKFIDPEKLGTHGYRRGSSEKNGILYTCKAGHIDTIHVRITADWTAFLAAKAFKHLKKNDPDFSFRLTIEPSEYFVHLTYPENWEDLSQHDKEQIARQIAVKLGQYLAYTATTWHEILTWFGYKCIGLYPEFPSAFSWEDSFSNVLGAHLVVQAINDTEHTYDEAMTMAFDMELEKLGIQSRSLAIQAAKKVRDSWFSGDLMFVEMRKRNLDIGLDDGFVTPVIIPSLYECEGQEPQPYPVPGTDFLSEYGFSMKLEIRPREWEKDKILKIIYPDRKDRRKRIEPAIHFAPIMDYISRDALNRYGPIPDPNTSQV